MSKNFKIVKIRASDGAHSLLSSGLDEMTAWKYAEKAELEEMERRPGRAYWYAVTNSSDWQSMALAFYRMKSETTHRRSL